MSRIANLVRIFEMEPSDDFVEKRTTAIHSIRVALEELTPASYGLEVASSIATALTKGALSGKVADIVEKAINHESSSFIRDGKDLEMLVCVLAAAQNLINERGEEEGRIFSDVLAVGLWSALSFQNSHSHPGVEAIRKDIIEKSRERVLENANWYRERWSVKEIADVTLPELKATLDALRDNAELDREEIELLWWVLAEYSEILELSLVQLDDVSRAIIAGFECARKLRSLPTDGHRNIALRLVKDGRSKTKLKAVIKQLGDNRGRLQSFVQASLVEKAPAVFPLLTAILNDDSDSVRANASLTARQWGARAMLEARIMIEAL